MTTPDVAAVSPRIAAPKRHAVSGSLLINACIGELGQQLVGEPTFEVVDHEPLIVLMPSDHRLTSGEAIHPREFVGEIFIVVTTFWLAKTRSPES